MRGSSSSRIIEFGVTNTVNKQRDGALPVDFSVDPDTSQLAVGRTRLHLSLTTALASKTKNAPEPNNRYVLSRSCIMIDAISCK